MYNFLLEKLIMPIGDLLNRSDVMYNLKNWRKISKLSEESILELQRKNLKDVLEFSTKNIPFYKKYADFNTESPEDWIKKLPIMKKVDYKNHINELTSKPFDKLIKKETSGSSGIQGITYMDEKDQSYNRAIQILWWEWSGWRIGSRTFQTGMTYNRGVLKSIKDILLRTKYYNAFGLSDEETLDILNKQRGKKGFYVAGYASSIYVLSKIAQKNNITDVKFKGAISWGDKMFPHFRKQILESFGCKVTDTYACSEGIMIAAQKDLEYYYIMAPHVYLELVDSNGNEVADGELGYVVASRLDARSMPLLRYYTGDLAVKLPKYKYPKEREYKYPLLERVIGRDTDIVYTASGKYMIVHFFTGIFEFVKEIKQFRVVQKELDFITIEYIPEINFDNEVLAKVEKTIQDYLKEPYTIYWEKVESIPATGSGKPQIIKSYIENKL